MIKENKEIEKRKNWPYRTVSLSIIFAIPLSLTITYFFKGSNLFKARAVRFEDKFHFSEGKFKYRNIECNSAKSTEQNDQFLANFISSRSNDGQKKFFINFFAYNQSTSSKETSFDNLQILHVSPQGPTGSPHEAEKIVVIFDRPMVALQALPDKEKMQPKNQGLSSHEEAENWTLNPIDKSNNNELAPDSRENQILLKIEPITRGEFRWIGTRTLVFTPHERFPFNTKIKVTIPSTTAALDGSRLGYDYSWEFETIRPKLIHHHPSHNDRWLPLQPEILLVFNQPMDEGRAAPFISWQASSSRAKISFKISHPKAERLKEQGYDLLQEYALILTLPPSAKLEPETKYEINLKKGLLAKEGNLGLEKDYAFNFETYNHFRFEGLVEAEDIGKKQNKRATGQRSRTFSPDEAIPFKFSNPISYKEFVSKVRFEPEVKIPDYYFNWEETSPIIYLSLAFEPETNYVVTIPADLVDEFGHQLGEIFKINFSTGSFPPSVSMTTGYGVIEAYDEPSPCFYLEAINQKSLRIQAAHLLPEDLVPLVRQRELFRSDKPYLPFAGFYQVDKDYELNLRSNKRQVVPIKLIDLHPSFKRGISFFR